MPLVPLTQGKFALVDSEDFSRVSQFKWYAQKAGRFWYAARREGKKITLLHRFLLGVCDKRRVDHRNWDTLDYRRENLRPATHGQNLCNRGKQRGDYTSVYKGVSYAPQINRANPWMAYINFAGKREHLGYFPTEIQAAVAYDTRARVLHGEFAILNFPKYGDCN